jgi:hypothetical protein
VSVRRHREGDIGSLAVSELADQLAAEILQRG